MKIFVWGIGGREHAIINSLHKNKENTIYALYKNGSIYGDINYIKTQTYTECEIIDSILKEKIDLVVLGSEELLAAGIADALSRHGICCFGPNQNAAKLESSKIFAKRFMERHNIPTAPYRCFDNAALAKNFLKTADYPLVIKADGLAKGKGVAIAKNYEVAASVIDDFMINRCFGSSGQAVVIEDFLTGPELSLFVLVDGKNYVILPTAMDYKKAKDGNCGKNTGGMGAISPNPYCTEQIMKICEDTVIIPTINGLRQENINYTGCLYFGLILTDSGPKVLEYNCRFGDPETQAILPLIDTDLADLLFAAASGTLNKIKLSCSSKACCCVVIADNNYPDSCKKGQVMDIDTQTESEFIHLLLANVKFTDGHYITDGGRLLNVVSVADSLEKAKELCYNYINILKFDKFYFRKDIGLSDNQLK